MTVMFRIGKNPCSLGKMILNFDSIAHACRVERSHSDIDVIVKIFEMNVYL